MTRRGPRGAGERLRRLLVMLPWLMERGEVSLAEVAAHFQMTPDEVAAELERAAMCGLPPFVDELIDIFIDGDMVVVGVPRLFTRPLRLTAPEGFALVAAGRAAMQLPGADAEGPLGRGLDKLAAALGDDGVLVDLPRSAHIDEVIGLSVDAARRLERLRIRYWTPHRDEVTEREITPRRVFSDRGEWYVAAADHRSGQRRTFRIDRIETAEATGTFDEPDDGVAEADSDPPEWFADGAVPRVTLRLAPEAAWVVERYPVDEVTALGGGDLRVRLAMASERWLARLLVRLGPYAEVLEPRSLQGIGRATAEQILTRYRA